MAKPDMLQEYFYYTSSDGKISSSFWNDDVFDRALFLTGNYAISKAELELKKEEIFKRYNLI